MSPVLIAVIIIVLIIMVIRGDDDTTNKEEDQKRAFYTKCKEEGEKALEILEGKQYQFEIEHKKQVDYIIELKQRMCIAQYELLTENAVKEIRRTLYSRQCSYFHDEDYKNDENYKNEVDLLKSKLIDNNLITETDLENVKSGGYYELTERFLEIIKDAETNEPLIFDSRFKVKLSKDFIIQDMHDSINEDALGVLKGMGFCLLFSSFQHDTSIYSNTSFYVTLSKWVDNCNYHKDTSNSVSSQDHGIKKII